MVYLARRAAIYSSVALSLATSSQPPVTSQPPAGGGAPTVAPTAPPAGGAGPQNAAPADEDHQDKLSALFSSTADWCSTDTPGYPRNIREYNGLLDTFFESTAAYKKLVELKLTEEFKKIPDDFGSGVDGTTAKADTELRLLYVENFIMRNAAPKNMLAEMKHYEAQAKDFEVKSDGQLKLVEEGNNVTWEHVIYRIAIQQNVEPESVWTQGYGAQYFREPQPNAGAQTLDADQAAKKKALSSLKDKLTKMFSQISGTDSAHQGSRDHYRILHGSYWCHGTGAEIKNTVVTRVGKLVRDGKIPKTKRDYYETKILDAIAADLKKDDNMKALKMAFCVDPAHSNQQMQTPLGFEHICLWNYKSRPHWSSYKENADGTLVADKRAFGGVTVQNYITKKVDEEASLECKDCLFRPWFCEDECKLCGMIFCSWATLSVIVLVATAIVAWLMFRKRARQFDIDSEDDSTDDDETDQEVDQPSSKQPLVVGDASKSAGSASPKEDPSPSDAE